MLSSLHSLLDPDHKGGHFTSSLSAHEGHVTSSLPAHEGHVTSSLPAHEGHVTNSLSALATEMDTSTEEENSDTGMGREGEGMGGMICIERHHWVEQHM